MEVKFRARIEKVTQYNGAFYYVVAKPAEDQYSMPSRFRVRCATDLGQIGTEHEFLVKLTGYVKNRQYRDRDTGQMRDIDDATVNLEVITSKPVVASQPQARAS